MKLAGTSNDRCTSPEICGSPSAWAFGSACIALVTLFSACGLAVAQSAPRVRMHDVASGPYNREPRGQDGSLRAVAFVSPLIRFLRVRNAPGARQTRIPKLPAAPLPPVDDWGGRCRDRTGEAGFAPRSRNGGELRRSRHWVRRTSGESTTRAILPTTVWRLGRTRLCRSSIRDWRFSRSRVDAIPQLVNRCSARW